MNLSERAGHGRSVGDSMREYGRGIIGGLIVSLPLLFTAEMWETGMLAAPERLLVLVGVTFLLLLGYNRYAGLRHDSSWSEVVIDSVEEIGLGLLLAALVLYLLGRIEADAAPGEILGMVVLEAMTVAIGVSVGTAQLGAKPDEDEGGGLEGDEETPSYLGQVVIAACGAVLFAANIGATEEIPIIASELSSPRLLAVAFVSIGLGAVTLFFSDFVGAGRYARTEGWRDIAGGAVMTYGVALAASALMLWFFGRFEGHAPVLIVGQTVVLGLAAVIGASAGRLLVQPR